MDSLWTHSASLPEFPTLEEDKKHDVLIIGGGMAGILTAYFLSLAGVDYILLEKDTICGGTTGNTTAKISLQHGLIYNKLEKLAGVENAAKYYAINRIALEKYKELCKDIECDFKQKTNFVYSLNDKSEIEKELSALEKIGGKAFFENCTELPFKTAGAVGVKNQAEFHPLKFAAAIAEKLNIYEHTEVTQMIGNTAVTQKAKVNAKIVIAATHFPFINKHGSYFLKLYQNRSYVIALENAGSMEGMYIDGSGKGLSFRDHNGLLLLGGGAHRTGKKGGGWSELREISKKYYPDSKEKYFWAAQDCMSLDGMPYIGEYSKNTQGMYTAAGFNKWGMTGAMAAALILCDMITGKHNEYAELFDPSRSILRPQLLINGYEVVLGMITPTKKRCPHLGCALKWNPSEHSWDCSCHGSRFDKNGRVLDNPANADMDL